MSEKTSLLSRLLGRENAPDPDGSEIVASPLDGESADITAVADKTFADKILGDGMAVIPTGNKLYAPVDGTVENLLDSRHALCILSAGGAELLIHVGRDTVTLNGRHFTAHVREGEQVRRGQLLLEFDREALLDEGFDLATPVVVSNSARFVMEKSAPGAVSHGGVLFRLLPKDE